MAQPTILEHPTAYCEEDNLEQKLDYFFERFSSERAEEEIDILFYTALSSEKANSWDHITREDKIFFIEELKCLIRYLEKHHNG